MFPIILLTSTGLLLAFAIGLVARFFGKEQDPRGEKLLALLPGANCGGCGFAGCADYVQNMLEGKAKPGMCPAMDQAKIDCAAGLLGVAAEKKVSKVAVVLCKGDETVSARYAFYNGVNDCANANAVAGGGKYCAYGCLGLGACSRACPFGAIEMTPAHLAVVHPDLCMGCGRCLDACPRHIIKLVPREATVHVLCSSPDSVKVKRKACTVGCIGCGKCRRSAQEGQIEMKGGLAVINYDNPPSAEVVSQCPVHVMVERPTTR